MANRPTPTRRRLLSTTGGLIALGLAGCIGAPSASPDDPKTGSNTESHDDHGSHETTTTGGGDADHSHHDDHHHEDVPDEPSTEVEVEMITTDGSYHFDPHVVWVQEGGTVTFVNESGSHSATAYAPANDKQRRIPEGGTGFDSGTLTEDGATHEVTFETPGVYDYYCIPHETLGMIGSIIVGHPDPHDQPGLSAPEAVPESIHEKIKSLNETVDEALGHAHEDSNTESETEGDHHHGESGTTTDHHED